MIKRYKAPNLISVAGQILIIIIIIIKIIRIIISKPTGFVPVGENKMFKRQGR